MTHPDTPDVTTSPQNETQAIKAVVRRNTEQVQGRGDFGLFDELFAEDFVDHTPQPGTTPDKAGVLVLYKRLRDAFPDFRTRDPLANRRRRHRDDLQGLPRHPPR